MRRIMGNQEMSTVMYQRVLSLGAGGDPDTFLPQGGDELRIVGGISPELRVIHESAGDVLALYGHVIHLAVFHRVEELAEA
jgi:hypothetical protein